MHKLVISDDEGKQTVVPLVRDEITIGRKEGNTIRLTERNVSRRHARLVKANGKFVVEDLHSYNGVKVNGQRIGAETTLEAGDQITIGDYVLALQVDGAEATVPQAAAPGVTDVDTAMIAAPGPPARLIMVTPPAPGAEFALTSDKVRIGRAEDLDVWVNHRSISREHAEIQKGSDGELRLIDLGSANGVRVNGKDVQNAVLAPGDMVELGQVRFRYVAAGEHYTFDADATMQMDAVTVEGASGGNRASIFVAVAIVLLAVVGAIVVAFWGADDGGDSTVVQPLDDDPAPTTVDDVYRTALTACRDALTEPDPEEALRQARAALAERPNDGPATACETAANNLQSQADIFARGQTHLDRGETNQAFNEFQRLPDSSPYRQGSQGRVVMRALRGYANERLQDAREDLEEHDNPTEALRSAQFVLDIDGITQAQVQEARSIIADAEAEGGDEASDPVAVVEPQPQGRRRRTSGSSARRGRRGGTQQTSDSGSQTTQQTQQTSTTTQNTTAGGGGGPSPEQQAAECTARGDNQCVIRTLEGRARSPRALALLIEAYRAQSRQSAAMRHMRTYVQRWPNTPQGRAYQQILTRQGQ